MLRNQEVYLLLQGGHNVGPLPKLHPPPSKSQSLEAGPRHEHFLQVPQVRYIFFKFFKFEHESCRIANCKRGR